MAFEIERKFLVLDDSFKSMAKARIHIRQYYISTDADKTVRVRISNSKAWLTVKSRNIGSVRHEWEYEIPLKDAEEMMAICGECGLSKTRYLVEYDGLVWEIDEFEGELAPLVVAEVELSTESQAVTLPPFVGKEVTGDKRYYNSVLCGIIK